MIQPQFTFGQEVYFRYGQTDYYKSPIIAIRNMGPSPYYEGNRYEYTVWSNGEQSVRSNEIADTLDNLKKLCLEQEKKKYEDRISTINGWTE